MLQVGLTMDMVGGQMNRLGEDEVAAVIAAALRCWPGQQLVRLLRLTVSQREKMARQVQLLQVPVLQAVKRLVRLPLAESEPRRSHRLDSRVPARG